MRAGFVFSLCLWALIIWALSGCSVHFELGYHGETGRDDRMYTTAESKSAAAAKARY